MWYRYDSGLFESGCWRPVVLIEGLGGWLRMLRMDSRTDGLWTSGLGIKRDETLRRRATENRCNLEAEGELSVYYRASWASLWVSNICYNFLSAILVMVTAFTETPFPRIWYDVTDGDFGVSHTVRLCPRLTNQGYLDYRSWVLCLYGCYSCMMEVRIYNLECLGSFVRVMVPLA